MRGLGAMEELESAGGLEFVGPALIPGELFDLGAYPGLRKGSGRVVGELYTILEAGILIQLDEFEGVIPDRPAQSLYLRERIQLIEPAGAEAWVYLYNRNPARDRRVDGGDWRRYQSARIGRRMPEQG
jgi:gamma-glutamylcyclotransferase (GGCT)/AIG2-like uncharacterized protein YtfP